MPRRQGEDTAASRSSPGTWPGASPREYPSSPCAPALPRGAALTSHTRATPPRFADLDGFVTYLERTGRLRRVRVEVDPILEIPELVQRVIREGGPALLFERPKGSRFPLVMNLFGAQDRIELALGRPPQAIGSELVKPLQRLNPPSLRAMWASREFISRARHMRPRTVRSAPVQEVVEAPSLGALRHLKSWPRDGGRFVTFGPTLTQDP